MELLSPKIIHPKKGGPFQASFEITKMENYILTENGIEITKSIETVYNSIPVNRFKATIPAVVPMTDDIIESYHAFQSLINHANNLAETLNNRLRDFLLTIKELTLSQEELMRMDFMTLRGIFSDFFHSYRQIKQQENFSDKEKRKNITSTFYKYIEDRNIYTHGTLKLRRPDEVFVIQFIFQRKHKLYAEVNADILKSNLAVGKWLIMLVSEISNFYNRVQTLDTGTSDKPTQPKN
jgi:hypothetical protein